MENSGGATTQNWTEVVEDFVHGGEIDKAVDFLESTVSNLEKELAESQILQNSNAESSRSFIADKLSTALQDLSNLYSSKGLSLKADQTLSRAFQIKHQKGNSPVVNESVPDGFLETHVSRKQANASDAIADDESYGENLSNLKNEGTPLESCADEDWEAIVDRDPGELISPQCLPGVSKLSLEDSKAEGTKRRGRGTFSYKSPGLYSDNHSDDSIIDDSENTSGGNSEDPKERDLIYGTHHILVLADFPPSTRTTDLEKMLEKFKDRFVIRWVNDTVALAVFRTPSIALEASSSIQFPFEVRILEPSDELLSSIQPRDLEPPRQRPRTSARTAQRLIAQGMGIKLPLTFGSTELRKQEEARKNRIVSRQNMRDDAWGGDVN